jgi:hypothetical protein
MARIARIESAATLALSFGLAMTVKISAWLKKKVK